MYVPDEIIVGDEQFDYVEKMLLPRGMFFDENRRMFLGDFSTFDLKAVPGSGKTTLLLAKLAILEQKLPLKSGKAVLVLSHTNAAVNEINQRLKTNCPKLFKYPNYIGTIQSFVNQYLATPYFESVMKKRVVSIDEEHYNKQVQVKYEKMKNYKLKSWLQNLENPVEFLQSIRFNEEFKLVKYINGKVEKFPLKKVDTESYKGLYTFKKSLLKKGILHYDDAYLLANLYLSRNPNVGNILRKRFGYVFVDEMQDMDIHQFKILELFNSSDVCFQRLGDNNQAIYNNIVHSENLWSLRKDTRTIEGSYRLNAPIASLASRFGVDGVGIVGLNKSTKKYKPILVVFDDKSIECQVIKSFSSYVSELFSGEEIKKYNYNVISWRKEHPERKLSLKEYCPKFLQMHRDTLNINDTDLSNAQIIKKVFNLIGVACSNKLIIYKNEFITRSNLQEQLYSDEENKKRVQRIMLDIVNEVNNKNYEKIVEKLKLLLNCVLEIFDVKEIDGIVLECGMLGFNGSVSGKSISKCRECCIFNSEPIMGTVHSVKGETHDVTVFLESFFSRNYETDILAEVISGIETTKSLIEKQEDEMKILRKEIQDIRKKGKSRGIKTRVTKINKCEGKIKLIQKYAKLVYVALSRAKSIVGYGVSCSKYEEYLKGTIDTDEWDVLFISRDIG